MAIGASLAGLSIVTRLPSELAPLEDAGWFSGFLTAPQGATLRYTDTYAKGLEALFKTVPEITHIYTVVARGERPTRVNRAESWVTLKDWSDRVRSQQDIVAGLNQQLGKLAGVKAYLLNPLSLGEWSDKAPVQFVLGGFDYQELQASEELLASNRAKAKAGVMSVVDVLQAEAAVASRVEQVLVAEKAIHDQEDQLRRLLNPGEEALRRDMQLTPADAPITTLEPISLEAAIDTAMELRPEIVQAKKNVESGELNRQFARNQLLPTLSFQGTMGLAGLGSDYGSSFSRNFSGDFYNYGAGLVFSYPLGNRSAISTYNKRRLEARSAEAALAGVRHQIIVGVREAVRRVQTDFKRIETTQSARILAEKQLKAEQERLKAGLSTTRFVLDFQHVLATAQGNELRAIIDYNKSLSNLSRHKATTLDRYHLELS